MKSTLRAIARDPLIARDSRPFGFGQRMHSLDWLRPSTVAGSLRTLLGKATGGVFDADLIARLKSLSLAGPLPLRGKTLFVPAPKDILIRENKDGEKAERFVHRLFPQKLRDGEGTDFGADKLPFMQEGANFKPAPTPAFWSMDVMTRWLRGEEPSPIPPDPKELDEGMPYLAYPPKEDRIHVRIDSASGTAEEGMLFSSTGLDLRGADLALRLEDGQRHFDILLERLDALHPCGGERRLLRWKREQDLDGLWSCPEGVAERLSGLKPGKGLRLILATPARFESGWKPKWLAEKGTGTIPGTAVKVRLVSAVTGRWEPLSGWSYETGGPKPLSRLVPAGSVYFFEILEGDGGQLVSLWLEPISDDEEARNDGYGLALWGLC